MDNGALIIIQHQYVIFSSGEESGGASSLILVDLAGYDAAGCVPVVGAAA